MNISFILTCFSFSVLAVAVLKMSTIFILLKLQPSTIVLHSTFVKSSYMTGLKGDHKLHSR